jgi:26S proteasome regulatory subunit N9
MGMAVLVGKEIYNIAELCEKETLKALIGTDHQWLYEILMTMDSGDIAAFFQVCEKYDVFNRSEVIKKNAKQLD